ncbi:hypothetical protein CDEST_07158 [Colletotrichum destructivum]|uniref:Uncharacterized protein n=1 Tax=Colletotrichum destructivum TaxID=34406 RepID=A0AAX4IFM4_9PEZI|nr:hypothetical protein CDEST_07158 [Colletotrichum destructivum]
MLSWRGAQGKRCDKNREIRIAVADFVCFATCQFSVSQHNTGIGTDKASNKKRPMILRDFKDIFLPGMPRKLKGVPKEEDQTRRQEPVPRGLVLSNPNDISDRLTSLGSTRRLTPQKARQHIAQGGRSNTASMRESSLSECAWRSTPNPGAHRSSQQAVHDVWERGGNSKLCSACMRHR